MDNYENYLKYLKHVDNTTKQEIKTNIDSLNEEISNLKTSLSNLNKVKDGLETERNKMLTQIDEYEYAVINLQLQLKETQGTYKVKKGMLWVLWILVVVLVMVAIFSAIQYPGAITVVLVTVAIVLAIFLAIKFSGTIETVHKQDAGLETEQQEISFEMVYVQGGTFTMGCTSEQSSEKPEHRVALSSFNIGKYEVTQWQWKAIMGSNPSHFKGDNLPVANVSWKGAQKFINKLNAATGKQYRLPTEAEWEYAARGGNKSNGYKYSGSNNFNDVAWYKDNSGKTTHPVGRKLPNELGIYDMSGNVCEWCGDWYGAYPASEQQDPMGASSGLSRVIRGGDWGSTARSCRVASRDYYPPGFCGDNLGFRVVLP
jgi:formylglycine-generating enzyme required for sulfatase activity